LGRRVLSDQNDPRPDWKGRTVFALAIIAGACLFVTVVAALVGILTSLNPLGIEANHWLGAVVGALLGATLVWATGRRRRNGD
jgi:hypothetical protein